MTPPAVAPVSMFAGCLAAKWQGTPNRLAGCVGNLRMILQYLRVHYCALLGLLAMTITLGTEMAMGTSLLNAATSRRPVSAPD